MIHSSWASIHLTTEDTMNKVNNGSIVPAACSGTFYHPQIISMLIDIISYAASVTTGRRRHFRWFAWPHDAVA